MWPPASLIPWIASAARWFSGQSNLDTPTLANRQLGGGFRNRFCHGKPTPGVRVSGLGRLFVVDRRDRLQDLSAASDDPPASVLFEPRVCRDVDCHRANSGHYQPTLRGLLGFASSLPVSAVICAATTGFEPAGWEGIAGAVYVGLFEMGLAYFPVVVCAAVFNEYGPRSPAQLPASMIRSDDNRLCLTKWTSVRFPRNAK